MIMKQVFRVLTPLPPPLYPNQHFSCTCYVQNNKGITIDGGSFNREQIGLREPHQTAQTDQPAINYVEVLRYIYLIRSILAQ